MLIETGRKLFLIFGCIIFFSCSFYCSSAKEIKKNGAVRVEKNNGDNSEYDKEGFISSSLFRIVIVRPGDAADSSLTSVKKKAKSRALASLQKYIMSNNGIINQNKKAQILNLIGEYGALNERISESKTRNVYHFDIQKTGLKRYVDDLAAAR